MWPEETGQGSATLVSGKDQHQLSAENGSQSQLSVESYHSLDLYDQEHSVSLERKMSTAASLTQAVMTGLHPHKKTSGLSLHKQSNFAYKDSLEDMYIEDLLRAKRKQNTQKTNIRATMGFWKLIWFDFKNWYKRWKMKNQESFVLKKYIKIMESNFGSAIGSLFVFVRWTMALNFLLSVLWLGFVILPTAFSFSYSTIIGEFAFKNLLDGKGVMAQSWLFYGSYTDTMGSYHVSLAYLLMMLITYFGSLFIVIGSITSANETKGSSTVEDRFRFSLMLWTSWDYSITSHDASVNLSKGITSSFKDNLYEAKASQDLKQRSRKDKFKVYCLRVLAWFITIILIGGGCTAIVYLVMFMTFENIIPNTGSGGGSDFLSVYGTTIIFSTINAVVPMCIQQLPKLEHYASGKDELNMTLTRIFILRMANLFALISSLYNTVTSLHSGCAGTVLGQELYKLVIMDTLLHSTMQLVIKFAKYFWTKKKAEFNISSAVLVLVYRQALVWVGTLACPVMPLVGLVSNLVFFCVNYMIVSATCKPPIKRWNQSRNTSFFMMFLLGSLAMLIPPMSVIIGSSDLVNLGQTEVPGKFCGPFGSDKPTRAYTRFYLVQTDWLKSLLTYAVSEPVLIPVFLIMLSLLIHQKTQMGGEKKHRLVIQAELQQEREENEKLIKKLQGMGIGVDRH